MPNAPPSSAAPTTTTTRTEPATIRVGGAVFEVGHEGDIVVTGDWDCDGTPGAALLRPGTGEVFAFDVLATPGAPVAGRLVTTLPDARSLETIDQPGGCTTLLARHADGSPQTLTVSES
jgi:hypothetical protein